MTMLNAHFGKASNAKVINKIPLSLHDPNDLTRRIQEKTHTGTRTTTQLNRHVPVES